MVDLLKAIKCWASPSPTRDLPWTRKSRRASAVPPLGHDLQDGLVGLLHPDGVATIGSGIVIGDNAKIGPNAMITKNVEGGEEKW